ncbi:hypothetical protein [Marinilabilia salmonicolor]|uniref:hypothetical protein n=1 Tax=Marinilabilia salmonicolor TaxID=989 RepID=UPI001F3ED874|nr:hypothetical protein [Marinilabilia salmonicolor]
MADSKGKRFFEKLKNKYKLAIFNEQTYQEVLVIRLSRLNVFTIVGASAILLIVLVILLIAFTGLREYIPGYPDANQRLMIVRNAQRWILYLWKLRNAISLLTMFSTLFVVEYLKRLLKILKSSLKMWGLPL